MKAELISIGDEILIGQIIDTNSVWIAKKLIEIGIEVSQMKSISDNEEDIVQSIKQSSADLIIITGGLGPTNDDLTKKTLVNYFDTELIFDTKVYEHIKTLLVGRGVIVNDLNKEQALLPKDAIILENKSGTAAGMWFEKENQHVISLPGVPFEMKGIMELEALPRIIKQFNLPAIVYKTVMTQGLPESMLAAKIKKWEDNLPKNIKLAYLPRPGIVRLRLTGKGNEEKKLKQLIDQEVNKLHQIIPNHIFGYDDIELETVIGQLLKERNKSLSTAESCTGGAIAALITSVAGSSAYYNGSVITYSNQLKNEQLNVSNLILENQGAVSQEVVEKMAQSVREKLKTTYSIAVSGIAGPGGGSDEKPVGTTWIAIASEDKVISKLFLFGEHRGRNITRASLSALNMLRLFILNKI